MIRKRLFELARVRFAISVLRDAGIKGVDIEDVYLGRHSDACVCWRCVLRLQNEVIMHQAEMAARRGWDELLDAQFASQPEFMAKGD